MNEIIKSAVPAVEMYGQDYQRLLDKRKESRKPKPSITARKRAGYMMNKVLK